MQKLPGWLVWTICVTVWFLSIGALTAFAQVPVATPQHVLAWDQDFDNIGALTYESAVDGSNTWGPVLTVTCTGTTVLACRGAMPQALTTGRHTVSLRTVRTIDSVRYISAGTAATTFDYLGSPTPGNPRNLRPTLPPGAAGVAAVGRVLSRDPAFGLDVTPIELADIPAPFNRVYFGALTLTTAGYSVQPNDNFAVYYWR